MTGIDPGALLNSGAASTRPPEVLGARRMALTEHLVAAFSLGVPLLLAAFIMTVFIPNRPLRTSFSDEPAAAPARH